jgi:hypothetical protein
MKPSFDSKMSLLLFLLTDSSSLHVEISYPTYCIFWIFFNKSVHFLPSLSHLWHVAPVFLWFVCWKIFSRTFCQESFAVRWVHLKTTQQNKNGNIYTAKIWQAKPGKEAIPGFKPRVWVLPVSWSQMSQCYILFVKLPLSLQSLSRYKIINLVVSLII